MKGKANEEEDGDGVKEATEEGRKKARREEVPSSSSDDPNAILKQEVAAVAKNSVDVDDSRNRPIQQHPKPTKEEQQAATSTKCSVKTKTQPLSRESEGIDGSNNSNDGDGMFDIETALYRVVMGTTAVPTAATTTITTAAAASASTTAVSFTPEDGEEKELAAGSSATTTASTTRGGNQEEWISSDTYVVFRVGHAGDAAKIASLYYESSMKTRTIHHRHNSSGGGGPAAAAGKENQTQEEALLELRLANGLGDEDTPPSVFALVGDAVQATPFPDSEEYSGNNDDDDDNKAGLPTTTLAAVALFTMAWEPYHQRVLRVEWFHVLDTIDQSNLLKRRLLLRLSTLALMTGCQLWLVGEDEGDDGDDDDVARPDECSVRSGRGGK